MCVAGNKYHFFSPEQVSFPFSLPVFACDLPAIIKVTLPRLIFCVTVVLLYALDAVDDPGAVDVFRHEEDFPVTHR